MSESLPTPPEDSENCRDDTNTSGSPHQQGSGPPSPQSVTWEETLRRWATTCSMCRLPCASEDAKQLALGHVMHWACYDQWLESLEEGAKRNAKTRNFAKEDELRRRFRKWKAGEL